MGSEECGERIEPWFVLQAVGRRTTAHRSRVLRTLRRRSTHTQNWGSAGPIRTANDRKRRGLSALTTRNRRELPRQRQRLSHTNGDRGTLGGCWSQSRRQDGKGQGRVQDQ